MNRNIVVGRTIRKAILVISIFAFVFRCYGQGFLVHHYSENDGLPSAEVYDMTQDHLGRMWFATRAGISCYDGLTWENYSVSDGLPALTFIKIAVDRQGQVLKAYTLPGEKQEGVALDAAGFLYLVQDSGGIIKVKWLKEPP